MVNVYREVLPEGFLLILLPHHGPDPDERDLTRALYRASRSPKTSVWVDCSLLEELSETALELLLAYAEVLERQGRALVLCHVPDPVRQQFMAHHSATFQPLMVESLLDACRHRGSPVEPARLRRQSF